MPAITSRRRSRAVFEDEEDNTASAAEDSRRKRPNGYRNHTRLTAESDEESSRNSILPSPSPVPSASQPFSNGVPSGDGEYAPGAIVRVLVENFVTYERAEFFPGPNLNMVIGPNGTGKSSLVCAICLGLGYGPKHLGRASQIGEFVKLGRDVATIEIELQKRPNDLSNHVIRVDIKREDNHRKWWLNGKDSTLGAVQKLTSKLHIQVDNLCQFLPQDKVAEFAGLTPVQLLHQTLRAAAPEEMLQWQAQLYELHKDHRKVKEQASTVLETLANLQSRQEGLQADVDRYRERDAVQQRIEDLRKARLVSTYTVARQLFRDAKRRRQEASANYEKLQQSCGPSLTAIEDKRAYADAIQEVIHDRETALAHAEKTGEQLLAAVDRKQGDIKDVVGRLNGETETFQARKGDIAKIRKALTDTEAKLKKKPLPFDAHEWNAKIREQEQVLRQNEAEKRDVRSQLEDIKNLARRNKEERDQLLKQKSQLDSQQGQQLLRLRQMNSDAHKGWLWLQENQDKFEKEVFGPPMLTASVKDDRYSDLIQSLLGKDDFFCFVAQTRNDHKTLSEYIFKQLKLNVTIRTCGNSFASYKAPLSSSELEALGLDGGFAIDYLDAPEPVLAMFCAEKKLHTSLLSLHEINDAQYNQITQHEQIAAWATGMTMHRISRRREYGPGATSTTTRQINKGQYWTDQPVDNSETVRLETRLKELEEDFNKLKAENNTKKEQLDEMASDAKSVQERIDDLRAQKSELQQAHTLYEALPHRLAADKKKLEDAQELLAACRERVFDLRLQKDQITIDKARLVLKHHEHLAQIKQAQQALLEARIRLVEAQSDARGLEAKNSEINKLLEEEEAKIKQLDLEADRNKLDAQEALATVRAALAEEEDSSAVMARLNAMAEGRSPEDLGMEIGAEEAKLELMQGLDPGVVRQFEKRAKEIEELTRRKDAQTGKLDSLTSQIQQVRAKWEPRVDELIGKINDAFSYNFEQISCAGEVGIHKDEDFEQWAIEIKVKFRQNETLQQLDQHRQSGGERAVSTIFYLMALQSMAQAPFRVVDEINQGMDPRNERMVHERMVEIACREHTSQYFLITPKLLTGLRYDERMRVLCIASGEHMPTEGRKMDFGKLVRIQKSIAAAG
ncbi:RecF/RecN/SMC N terminal domain-containing protein [Microdochium trichocladiopsis]|uniref:Structural maintenance of chromosomes protein 5 n=1 Tax=Microdochium trichocladiopsis TaxID=1682393 RepID=A0A9P8YGJ5_9PEZI|nr:RecF/RecN/SMC N terminal domain-containing protein [Microdochium trichocladiopsis]KAH7037584.1 RecF/RecN/SMC N terminal domain-containing protein [Microdochium trichocladiopsis]